MYDQALKAEKQKNLETYKWEKIVTSLQLVILQKAAETAILREKDCEIAQRESENTKLHGHEKYLQSTFMEVERHEPFKKLEKISQSQYSIDSQARAKTHNPYLWGGMVDGLLGPGAGIATALQTMEENAAEEQRAAQTRECAWEEHMNRLGGIDAMRSLCKPTPLHELEETIDEVRPHVIDEGHADDCLANLSITEVGRQITPEGSLNIKLRIRTRKRTTLQGKPAIIDGSLAVRAIVDGSTYAIGHLSAPSKDVTCFSENTPVGFNGRIGGSPFETWVMLVPLRSTDSFGKNTRYGLKFSPVHLWMIQR